MSKKEKAQRLSIIFFSLAALGFVLVFIFGVKLSEHELVYLDADGLNEFIVEETETYYILLDTKSVRVTIQTIEDTIYDVVTVYDDEENTLYEIKYLVSDDQGTEEIHFEQVEFDLQVLTREYLSYGRLKMTPGTYTINSRVEIENDDFGSLALLDKSYVNKTGLFSLSSITVFMFALLGYKQHRIVNQKEVSKYKRKRTLSKGDK